ncbi:MAG TPA: hypothetical protein V6C58_04565 [Allocoleopsis sp.]
MLRIQAPIDEQYQWHLYLNMVYTKVFTDLHRHLENGKQEKALDILNRIRAYAIIQNDNTMFELEKNMALLRIIEEFKDELS